jgi:hypothetical protein
MFGMNQMPVITRLNKCCFENMCEVSCREITTGNAVTAIAYIYLLTARRPSTFFRVFSFTVERKRSTPASRANLTS